LIIIETIIIEVSRVIQRLPGYLIKMYQTVRVNYNISDNVINTLTDQS